MKGEILMALKSMIAADATVTDEQRELALLVLSVDPTASRERLATAAKVMSGKLSALDVMPLCKRAEAADLLGLNVRTVDYYIRIGKLPGVRGCGSRIIGIPRENVIELMLHRGQDPKEAYR